MANVIMVIGFEDKDANSNKIINELIKTVDENGGKVTTVDVKNKTLLSLM